MLHDGEKKKEGKRKKKGRGEASQEDYITLYG
jgi:hypothetical protein